METPDRRKIKNKITPAPLSIGELGKVPPQDIQIEQTVLGAMMLERFAVNETIDILHVNSFYDPKHQYIYSSIRELFAGTSPIDLITVTEHLRRKGELEAAGGVAYIASLTNRVGSAANIQAHARIISEKYIKRELIRVSSEILRDSYDDTIDVFDLLNRAEKELFGIAENNMSKQVKGMPEAVREAVAEIEKASLNKDGVSGVPTGFHALDKVTAGWQRSDMIVLAARPGMGKTAFVLSMARNTAVDYNMGVAVFSLEMSAVQLVKRLIASESRLNAEKLRKGSLADHEYQQLYSRITKLATAPIFIDDTPGISILDFRAKCRRLKHEKNIEIVIIDYLQLMSAGDGKGNREQEISTISRSIKEIAKELNVPIIALSQLSRSVETRGGDKRPMLSDLRESGAIEQDADIVSFIYRPEYYKIQEDANGNSTANMGEIIIAKHRNGSLENVRLRFIGEFARFENMDEYADFDTDINKPIRERLDDFMSSANTITVPSKMNSNIEDNDIFNKDDVDDTPF